MQTHYEQSLMAHHHASLSRPRQTLACGAHYGAGFLFIHDLTTTATGVVLVVLIVLYVGTQLVSSLMMQAPTMDQNQRRMMLLLPLFFVIFIIRFPAGLIVYWITTNAWTMAQQYVIRRRIGPPRPRRPRRVRPPRCRRPAMASARGLMETARPRAAAWPACLRGRSKPEDKQPATVGSSAPAAKRHPSPAAQEEEALGTPALAMAVEVVSAFRVRPRAARADRRRDRG